MRKRVRNSRKKWASDSSASVARANSGLGPWRLARLPPPYPRATGGGRGQPDAHGPLGAPSDGGHPPGQNKRLARFVANTADHGLEPVRSLRREVLPQSETLEQRQRVDVKDPARRFSRVKGEQNRDQAAHDVCVAVARKAQDRRTRTVGF